MSEELELQPWDQLEGEKNKWFQRFTLFRLMGPNRTVLGAQNAEKERDGKVAVRWVAGAWRDQARDMNWRDRAAAWDVFINEQDESAWMERRKEQREKEWRVSTKLADRAEAMLGFPIMRREVEEICECGRPAVTIIEAVDWNARDAVAFAKAASELARAAAEMEQSRTVEEHKVKVIGNVDLGKL